MGVRGVCKGGPRTSGVSHGLMRFWSKPSAFSRLTDPGPPGSSAWRPLAARGPAAGGRRGTDPKNEVTQLLASMSRGDPRARDVLLPLVYDELRRLAGAYLRRERSDHTLQATALVHEAYIRLVEQSDVRWRNRGHFFGVAAQLMRHILVDHARGRLAAKRGGELVRVPITDAIAMSQDRPEDLLVIDESLNRLAAMDPRQARIVELRVFGGMTMEEVAESVGVSLATSKRDWAVAKAWLLRELRRAGRP